ncbi:MAG: internalin [Bacteroidaceae bacterium]|nr:internalin [Bacteroidaceae bacterium]
MKKTLLLFFGLAAAMTSSAQAQQLTMTFEVNGIEREIYLGSAEDNNVVTADWGDGKIVPLITLPKYDGSNYQTVKGTVVGAGVVKFYTSAPLSFLDVTSNMNGAGMTSIDVSQATELTRLYLSGNKLTNVDFTANSKLARVFLNNNKITSLKLPKSVTYLNIENNALTSFDPAVLPDLNYLHIGQNKLTTLDVSTNPLITSIYAYENQLTNFKLGNNAQPRLVVNVSSNKLEKLDLRGASTLGVRGSRIFVQDNQLTEILYDSLAQINMANNRLTLATIPVANVIASTYAPQQDMAIAAAGAVVDLSSQAKVGDQVTTFKWYAADKTEIPASAYTEANGRFTFTQAFDGAYCTMTNPALPKFTATAPFKTAAVNIVADPSSIDKATTADAPADVYSLGGVLLQRNADLNALPAGTYVVKGRVVVK